MCHITTWEEDYKGNNTSPSLQSPLANSHLLAVGIYMCRDFIGEVQCVDKTWWRLLEAQLNWTHVLLDLCTSETESLRCHMIDLIQRKMPLAIYEYALWQSTVPYCAGNSARNGPVYAGIPYRILFLFMNFVPALTDICCIHLSFYICMTAFPCFAFKSIGTLLNFHWGHWL
jgi:hypothetical protein